jgi:hypothetical protein
VRIELLYWEGCPSHPEALALLEEVLYEHGVAADVRLTEVTSDAEAAELRFPGSPTIRVDGADVDPDGAGTPPGLTCRIYRLPDGVSPVPSRRQLEAAVAKAVAAQDVHDLKSGREERDVASHG